MARKRNRAKRTAEKYQRFPGEAELVREVKEIVQDLPLPSASNNSQADEIVKEMFAEDTVDPALKVPGMPPNYGKDVIPHVISFTGLISTIAKVYRPSDNALQASWQNASYMLNDTSVTECLEQRMRSTALLNWHLEVDDETDPAQQKLVDELTAIIESTPRFMQYRESLLRALWFGKYGNKHRFRWKSIGGQQRICIDKWEPVHGDKLVFRYDTGTGDYDPDQVGIRVGAGFHSVMARSWQQDRLSQIQLADIGLAYFLKPYERSLLAIHKHMTEDGEWEDVESAGRIHGVGIRHRIYWCWYQMQECIDGDAIVCTDKGEIPLSQVGAAGATQVLSYDEARCATTMRDIQKFWDKGERECLLISTDDRSIKATLDHLFYTPTGWRRADSLSIADAVLVNGDCATWTSIVAIERIGVCRVYDIQVEGTHSFFANNILVHNCLAWLMEFLERSAFGMEIWYYPWGDKSARDQMYTAAQDRIGQGRNIILVPRPVGEASQAYGVERIEPAMAGAEVLAEKIIKELFGFRIKRYILGQTLTTEAGSTGLGSNLASVHLDTYLQIVRYDAMNLEETMTTELVKPLKEFNFPAARDVQVKFVIDTEAQDVDGKLNAWQSAYNMGCRLKEEEVMDLIGASIPGDDDVPLVNPQIEQQKRLTQQFVMQQQAQMQQQAMGMVPGDQSQPPPAEEVAGQIGAVPEQYKQNAPSLRDKGGWRTVGGGAHVYIDGDGKVKAGCPGLKGEEVDEIGENESDGHRDVREHRQDVAEAHGIEGDEISHAEVEKLENVPHPETGQNAADQQVAPPTPDQIAVNGRTLKIKQHDGKWFWSADPQGGWNWSSPDMVKAIESAISGQGATVTQSHRDLQAERQKVILKAKNRQAGVAARQENIKRLVAVAEDYGISPDELNDALDYILEERVNTAREREAIRARARQLTGFTASDISRLENAGFDHSSGVKVPGRAGQILRSWDQFGQELAREHPELGWGSPDDPRVDFGAELWDLLKAGRQELPSRYDPQVLREAANVAVAHRGGGGGAQEFDDFEAPQEVVPFAKRGTVERYAKWLYAKKKSAAGQSSLWKESEHPRDDDGQFSDKDGGNSSEKPDDSPEPERHESLPGQMDLFGGEAKKPAEKKQPPKLADMAPERKAKQTSMFHGLKDLLGQRDLLDMDYKDEAFEESLPEKSDEPFALPDITGGSQKQNSYAKDIRQQFVDRVFRTAGHASGPTPAGMAFLRSLTSDAKTWIDAKHQGQLSSDSNLAADIAEDGAASELWNGRAGVGHRVYGKYLAALLVPEGTDKLPGGPADNKPDSDFDPKQLAKGTKEELEHTDDPSIAGEIAKDHLVEGKKYAAGDGPLPLEQHLAKLQHIYENHQQYEWPHIDTAMQEVSARPKHEAIALAQGMGITGSFRSKADAVNEIRNRIAGRKRAWERNQWDKPQQYAADASDAEAIVNRDSITPLVGVATAGPKAVARSVSKVAQGVGAVNMATGGPKSPEKPEEAAEPKKYAAATPPQPSGSARQPDFSDTDLAALDRIMAEHNGTAELTDRNSGEVYRYTASNGGLSVEKTRSGWSSSVYATPEAQQSMSDLFSMAFREHGWNPRGVDNYNYNGGVAIDR